jgi:hypothetical protein
MNSAITQPYEHLAKMLTTLAASTRASRPRGPHAEQWSRAAVLLEAELGHLRSFDPGAQAAAGSAPPDHAALKNVATRLTQLARTQDGLRLEESAAASPDQLADERRLVVFAAWQLQQAIEYATAMQPAAAGK